MVHAPIDLTSQIALVTGSSRGIGRAIAVELAKAGAHIIAVARTQGSLEELDDFLLKETGRNITGVPLDLKDFDGIDRLGHAIYERWGKLDILVGNAGILGTLSPVPHLKPKTWDDVIATNLTANFRLIRAMDPLLRQSEAARAVFVTSSAAARSYPYWGAYATSKAGLEMLVNTYAEEVRDANIRVSLMNPGAVRTHMRGQAFPGEDKDALPMPWDVAPRVFEFV